MYTDKRFSRLIDILIRLVTDTNNQSNVYILLYFYIFPQLHPNSISIKFCQVVKITSIIIPQLSANIIPITDVFKMLLITNF